MRNTSNESPQFVRMMTDFENNGENSIFLKMPQIEHPKTHAWFRFSKSTPSSPHNHDEVVKLSLPHMAFTQTPQLTGDDSSESSQNSSCGQKSFESHLPSQNTPNNKLATLAKKKTAANQLLRFQQTLSPTQDASANKDTQANEEPATKVSPNELFALIMKSSNGLFTLNGKRYQVESDPKDCFMVVNLGNELSRILQVKPEAVHTFSQPKIEPITISGPIDEQELRLPNKSDKEKNELEGAGEMSFGATDDNVSIATKAGKTKKKRFSIKVQLDQSPPVLAEMPSRAYTVARKQEESVSNEQEMDIKSILQLEKEFEQQMKRKIEPKTAGVRKYSFAVSAVPDRRDSEVGQSFDFQVFNSRTRLAPESFSFKRKMTTMVPGESVKQEHSEAQFNHLLTEYKKIQDHLTILQTFKKAKLHVGFLFASPFCQISSTTMDKNHYLIFPSLQFQREIKNIKAAAKEAKSGIIFKSAVSTQTNFVQMLSKSPKMIHISCHGIPNNANTMKDNYSEIKHEGDFLLFEHETLIGELVSEKSLKNLISNVWETELVFLAACDSEFAAKIFLKKGARHVICIKESKEVLDTAVITFTNTFYSSVFNGKSICDAFSIAKNLTANIHTEREASIFKLLKEAEHECIPIEFNSESDVKFQDISDKILVQEIPAKIENMLFREKEMAKLIQKIMDGQRLVFVFGLFGIGKSWIARHVLHFLKERKYFCGGLIFVSLKGTRTIEALCHQLYGLLVKNLVITNENREFLEGLLDSKADTIDFFVDFFNQNTSYVLKACDRYNDRDLFKNETSKKFLVCLDNAEELIEYKQSEFKQLLKKLLNSCPYLQILITSRKHLLKIDDNIDTDPLFIPELKGNKPVELFLKRTEKFRQISISEIIEIIKLDKEFDLPSFSKQQIQDLDQPGAIGKLQQLLRQSDKVIEALRHHDLFTQFAGNPLSITNLAACYANPLNKKDLKDLYQMMLQGKLELTKMIDDEDSQKRGQQQTVGNENQMSLQVCIGSSVQLLAEQSPEAEGLLYFLSLLPSGVKKAQLKQMWGDNVEQQLKIIEIYDFFEIGFEDCYIVTPFVTNYLQETIQNSDKDTFVEKICAYYCVLLKRLYKIISLADKVSDAKSSQQISSTTSKTLNAFKYPRLIPRERRSNSVESKTFCFQQCLLSHIQSDSPTEHNPVIEESLNQILNIERCIEMLITRESESFPSRSVQSSLITESDVNSNSIYEYRAQKLSKSNEKSYSENSNEKSPYVRVKNKPAVEAKKDEPKVIQTNSLIKLNKMQTPSDSSSSNVLKSSSKLFTAQSIPNSQNKEVAETEEIVVSPDPRQFSKSSMSPNRTDPVMVASESARSNSPQRSDGFNRGKTTIDVSELDSNKNQSLLKKSSLKQKHPSTRVLMNEESKEDAPRVLKKPTFKLNDEIVIIKPLEEERTFISKSQTKHKNSPLPQIDESFEDKDSQKSDHKETPKSQPNEKSSFKSTPPSKRTESDFSAHSSIKYKKFAMQFKNPITFDNSRLYCREEMSETSSELVSDSDLHESPIRRKSYNDDSDYGAVKSPIVPTTSGGFSIDGGEMKRYETPFKPGEFRRLMKTHQNGLHHSQTTEAIMLELDEEQRPKFKRSFSKIEDPDIRRMETKITKIERKNNLSIQAKKRRLQISRVKANANSITRSVTLQSILDPDQNLTETEAFINYAIALMYLSNSFQVSLGICNADFKSKFKNKICQANVLRFKALNLEQCILREPADKEGKAMDKDLNRVNNITEAMNSLQKAYKLYKAKQDNMAQAQQPCIHGMALTLFHMAYLYQNYSSELRSMARIKKFGQKISSQESISQTLKRPFSTNDVEKDKSICRDISVEYYKKAYNLFWMINHLKGGMITAERIVNANPDEPTKAKYTQLLQQCSHLYEEYINQNRENPFVLRKQGEIISLLSELVMNASNIKLFSAITYKAQFTQYTDKTMPRKHLSASVLSQYKATSSESSEDGKTSLKKRDDQIEAIGIEVTNEDEDDGNSESVESLGSYRGKV